MIQCGLNLKNLNSLSSIEVIETTYKNEVINFLKPKK